MTDYRWNIELQLIFEGNIRTFDVGNYSAALSALEKSLIPAFQSQWPDIKHAHFTNFVLWLRKLQSF